MLFQSEFHLPLDPIKFEMHPFTEVFYLQCSGLSVRFKKIFKSHLNFSSIKVIKCTFILLNFVSIILLLQTKVQSIHTIVNL